MEFLGLEVKPGTPLKVEVEVGYIYHISQIAVDVTNVKDENIPVYVKLADKQKLVIGNLSHNTPQIYPFDLVFEQDFELSHECESSSVFVLGYRVVDIDEDIYSDDSDEEAARTEYLQGLTANGVNGENEDGESESDEEDESDSQGEDEDSDEADGGKFDEAPLKILPPSKKRPNGGALNNNNNTKKARVAIPQKSSGGKKGGKN